MCGVYLTTTTIHKAHDNNNNDSRITRVLQNGLENEEYRYGAFPLQSRLWGFKVVVILGHELFPHAMDHAVQPCTRTAIAHPPRSTQKPTSYNLHIIP